MNYCMPVLPQTQEKRGVFSCSGGKTGWEPIAGETIPGGNPLRFPAKRQRLDKANRCRNFLPCVDEKGAPTSKPHFTKSKPSEAGSIWKGGAAK